MLAAIAHAAVRILAHPRGRITGSRAGVIANWDAVFASAAQRGVAIEIDGDPARQDFDHALASRALEAGALDRLLAWLSNPSRNVDSELIAVVTKSSRYGKPDGT